MPYWNREKLREQIQEHNLITHPDGKSAFDPKRLNHCSYELALGVNHLVTAKDKPTEFDLEKVGASLSIPSGQFALLMTEEVVKIPLDAVGFISIRARIKFKGLINVSGFHVDPGFEGRLRFSVYNAGATAIPVARGDAIFMIFYADLSGKVKTGYTGDFEKNNQITSKDRMTMQGEIASPGELMERFTRLRTEVRFVESIFLLLIGIILTINIEKGCNPGSSASSGSPINIYAVPPNQPMIATNLLAVPFSQQLGTVSSPTNTNTAAISRDSNSTKAQP